jgi:hypothetical protein
MIQQVDEIVFDQQGVYKVATRHSDYLIDLHKKTLARVPGAKGNALRGDGEELTLVNIHRCAVGFGAYFIVSGLAQEPPFLTTRGTTEVLSIDRVAL